jgi:NDP-sugar pyrophosphorylase family protein
MKKAAILAAGDGLRIKSIALYKPIVKINGTPLLELTFTNLHFKSFNKISIIFNESAKKMDLTLLPGLSVPGVNYFFKSTLSSMHSLYEVSQKLDLQNDEHLFVSMVDSIVIPHEALNFHQFCLSLKSDESALLVTSYIEDEKPLTLKLNDQGYITEFQCPLEDGVLITSGVYYFSVNVFPLLLEMIEAGQTKMRNFLTELVKRNHKIKVFESMKTLDIDRPEDIQSAEIFLKENAL